MSNKTSVTPAIAFVDLATFDELAAYMYGGCMAVTYFVRSVKKSNWFSFVAIGLRHVSGSPDFGQEFSASVNRSGDYVLNVWLRVKVPKIKLNEVGLLNDQRIDVRWTHNFMHQLVKHADITFNELCVHEFDSCWLDFNHYFRTTASKRVGYDTMIGEVEDMTDFQELQSAGGAAGPDLLGTGGYFNLPLPFFFTEDSGVALPVAALPFNDIKINYCLRAWEDMIVVNVGGQPASAAERATVISKLVTEAGTPVKLQHVETNAHYAVIHNDERVLMGKCPRDILIHQVQLLQEQPFLQSTQNSFDLRFSHAVHFLAWAARNETIVGELSNYSVLSLDNDAVDGTVNLNGFDPIAQTVLIYENTARVDMGADYYSTVVPYYWCDVIPDISGMHGYSYSLEAFGLDPQGSTGYSKLANVSICLTPSAEAADSERSGDKYKFCLRARNHNVVRLSGGSLGLPVL